MGQLALALGGKEEIEARLRGVYASINGMFDPSFILT
jgi:hypothetical protein